MTHERCAYLPALGVVSPLGAGKQEVAANLFAGASPGMVTRNDLLVSGEPIVVGAASSTLPPIPDSLAAYASRNLALAIAATEEIRDAIDDAVARYGRSRIAVVMGTSTSGIAEGEAALRSVHAGTDLPSGFDMRKQELGSAGEALARYLGLEGPALTVSTACSSSAQALAMGRRFLNAGLADAVVAGGADSLCRTTTNGFKALSALSAGVCNPFSRNRDGTTIGEGAAIFLMDRREAEIGLFGTGSSSDAYSITAPEPEGAGVERAVREALDDADLAPEAVDYVHLHGTGTRYNDAIESKVVARVFGRETPCSSSKGQIGHTLGAAGAMGAAHCWLSAAGSNAARSLPPHLWDGDADAELLSTSLVAAGTRLAPAARGIFVCNTIAFGGNNAVLVIGRTE